MRNFPLLASLAGLGWLAGCGREASPVGGKAEAVVEVAAPAASLAASSAPPPATPGPVASAMAPQPRALARATAEQLLAEVRASSRKATLVNAWASWCGPCRRELPMLQALAANLKPQGVRIVLVSVDDPKDEAKALSFLHDNAITLDAYLVDGSVADFKQGINPRWPGMLPASFLFDGGGQLVHFWGGEAFENEIVPVVEGFVAGRPISSETRFGLAPGKSDR